MPWWICFVLCLCGGVRTADRTDKVDLLELNHHYDKCGHHCFCQVIAWGRDPAKGTYHVREWKLVEYRESVNVIPTQQPNGRWRAYWPDHARVRFVEAPLFRETWTMDAGDPERRDHSKTLGAERFALTRSEVFQKIRILFAEDSTE